MSTPLIAIAVIALVVVSAIIVRAVRRRKRSTTVPIDLSAIAASEVTIGQVVRPSEPKPTLDRSGEVYNEQVFPPTAHDDSAPQTAPEASDTAASVGTQTTEEPAAEGTCEAPRSPVELRVGDVCVTVSEDSPDHELFLTYANSLLDALKEAGEEAR